MEMRFLFVSLFGLILLLSCSRKKDYVYNEVMSKSYYRVSNLFEDVNNNFESGHYVTNFEYGSHFTKNNLLIISLNLHKLANSSYQAVNHLDRSDDTDKVNALMLSYFEKVGGDYVDALTAYAKIDCDCGSKKDSISAVVKTVYREISSLEDRALGEQKIWFEKAEIIGTERK